MTVWLVTLGWVLVAPVIGVGLAVVVSRVRESQYRQRLVSDLARKGAVDGGIAAKI